MRRQKLNALFFLLFLFNYTYAQEYEQKTEITNILVENRTYGNEPIPVYVQIKNAGEQPLVFNDFEVKVATADFGEVNKLCVDKNISLLPGRTQTYTVIVPHLPSGDYVIYPQWFSRSFGREDLKSASVQVDTPVIRDVEFVEDSIQVLGGTKSEFNWANQKAGEPVRVVGDIRNLADRDNGINLTLNVYEWNKCENSNGLYSATETKLLPASSASGFTFEVKAPQKPTAYEVELLALKEGVIVSRAEARIITEGASARIDRIALDKHTYKKGERAALFVSVLPPADAITNITGSIEYVLLVGGHRVYSGSRGVNLTQAGDFSQQLLFDAQEDLSNFVLNVTLRGGDGAILDSFMKSYETQEFERTDDFEKFTMQNPPKGNAGVIGAYSSTYNILLTALTAIIILFWIRNRRKGDKVEA